MRLRLLPEISGGGGGGGGGAARLGFVLPTVDLTKAERTMPQYGGRVASRLFGADTAGRGVVPTLLAVDPEM